MGIGRRIIDLARSNLASLFDPPAGDALHGYSDDELAAELAQRRDRKRRRDEAEAARLAAEQAARERAEQARRAAAQVAPRSRLEELYRELDTPVGADLETVKQNFRRLMRQHHPDFNGGSAAATERTQRLTAALDELENFLTRI